MGSDLTGQHGHTHGQEKYLMNCKFKIKGRSPSCYTKQINVAVLGA